MEVSLSVTRNGIPVAVGTTAIRGDIGKQVQLQLDPVEAGYAGMTTIFISVVQGKTFITAWPFVNRHRYRDLLHSAASLATS